MDVDSNNVLSASVFASEEGLASLVGAPQISPQGHFAFAQQLRSDGTVAQYLVELSRKQWTEIHGVGLDAAWEVTSLRWADEQRLLVFAEPHDGTSDLMGAVVSLDAASGEHHLGEARRLSSLSREPAVSPDGNWIAYYRNLSTDLPSFELAPIVANSVEAPTHVEYGGFMTPMSQLLWANSSSSVSRVDVIGDGRYLATTHWVAPDGAAPSAVTYPTNPQLRSSAGSTFLIGQPSSAVPRPTVQVLDSGVIVMVPGLDDYGVWSPAGTTPNDSHLYLKEAGRIAISQLRDQLGNVILSPQATFLADHGISCVVGDLTIVRDGTDIVYPVTDSTMSVLQVFWLTRTEEPPVIQRISDWVGTEPRRAPVVAKRGDYAAIATDAKIYLVKLEQPPTVTVLDDELGGTVLGDVLEVAWAPDDSGLIFVTGTHQTQVFFLPRLPNPGQGFGPLAKATLAQTGVYQVLPILPQSWQ